MRKNLFWFFFLLINSFLFNSCKKENPVSSVITYFPPPPPIPPVARAGNDKVLQLPIDSIKLDGSSSSDTNGTITSYKWTKISGPDIFEIVNPDASITIVKKLVKGKYEFALKVTNAKGLSSSDTVTVLILAIPPPLLPLIYFFDNLSWGSYPNGLKYVKCGGGYGPSVNPDYSFNQNSVKVYFRVTGSVDSLQLSYSYNDLTGINSNSIYYTIIHEGSFPIFVYRVIVIAKPTALIDFSSTVSIGLTIIR